MLEQALSHPLTVLLAIIIVGIVLWFIFRETRPKPAVRIYIAGTMSGNDPKGVCDQGYRLIITDVLNECYEGLDIDDPYIGHEDSLSYNDEAARFAFNDCLKRASENADILIAYIPEASMGTALEMFMAYNRKKYVVTVTPLVSNWVVRLYSDLVYESMDEFISGVRHGELNPIIFSIDSDVSRCFRAPSSEQS